MSIRTVVRPIGNALGFIVPRTLLEQAGFSAQANETAELVVEDGAIVLRPATPPVRAGWAAASAKIAEVGDDHLVMGEFGNRGDSNREW